MAISAPTQERSVDPYSDNRFSSVINRLSRLMTGGVDCIIYPEVSFPLTKNDYHTVKIGSGLASKDDVLIHTTADFYLDFSDSDYYVDPIGGMDTTGTYYIVFSYTYTRSFPAPKGYFKIIKDVASYYTPFTSDYIYIGYADITFNSGELRYEVNSVGLDDPGGSSRELPTLNQYVPLVIDGGEVT